MVFSTNQNRHLYAVNAYSATVDDTSAKGTIGDVKVVDGVLHFKYKGAENTLKSDYIQLKNLDYVKSFAAADMRTPLKSVKVSLDANALGANGNVVAGQDYILRISFRQWIGCGDQHQYFKDGAVHGINGMTPAQFYQKMVDSLNLCFSREIGATKTSNPYLTFTPDATGIIITEKPQSWTLGLENQERVLFDVQPTTIYTGGEDIVWAAQDANTGKYYQDLTPAIKIEDTSNPGSFIPNPALVVTGANANAIGNGNKIADMEWFYMGERGDQYRNIGWPNVIKTEYLVDHDLEYNVLEIHHAFTDTGVNSYRSEKDITIVSSNASVLNQLIGELNQKASLSIANV